MNKNPVKISNQLKIKLIQTCKIRRLDISESLEYCHKNNWKCSKGLFLKWKDRYKKSVGERFDQATKDMPARAVLQAIDDCKKRERELWKYLEFAESAMDAKRTLDSLREIQGELLMLYNDTSLLKQIRETFDKI